MSVGLHTLKPRCLGPGSSHNKGNQETGIGIFNDSVGLADSWLLNTKQYARYDTQPARFPEL
jgi:hypothetical protein